MLNYQALGDEHLSWVARTLSVTMQIKYMLTLLLSSVCLTTLGSAVESAAQVKELRLGNKRSANGERKFEIVYDGGKMDVDLLPSVGVLPTTLRVHVLDTDKNGDITVEDWTHTVSSVSAMLQVSQLTGIACLMVSDLNHVK